MSRAMDEDTPSSPAPGASALPLAKWSELDEIPTSESEAEPDAEPDAAGAPGAPGAPADAAPEVKCLWEDCGETFTDLQPFIAHLHSFHIGIHKSRYACEWTGCPRKGKSQTSRFALLSHLRSHTGEKPFTCPRPECDKSFTRSDALAKHMRVQHNTPPAGQARTAPGLASDMDDSREHAPDELMELVEGENSAAEAERSFLTLVQRAAENPRMLPPAQEAAELEQLIALMPPAPTASPTPSDSEADDAPLPSKAYLVAKAKLRYLMQAREQWQQTLLALQEEETELVQSCRDALDQLLARAGPPPRAA